MEMVKVNGFEALSAEEMEMVMGGDWISDALNFIVDSGEKLVQVFYDAGYKLGHAIGR